jgi:hypothetical protein
MYLDLKARSPLGEFVRANSKKVGTDPTFSRRIFSLTNHIASHIVFRFASREKIRLVENGLKATCIRPWLQARVAPN